MAEYVRLTTQESLYGDKGLLYGELGILNIVKRIRNYEKLREEELVLKIAIKNKIGEVIERLNILDKLLPHQKMQGLHKRETAEDRKKKEAALTLEQELEQIRRRLEKLKE